MEKCHLPGGPWHRCGRPGNQICKLPVKGFAFRNDGVDYIGSALNILVEGALRALLINVVATC